MKRQLNISINESLWLDLHTKVSKGEVTKIIEDLLKCYFIQESKKETDEEKIKKEINFLELEREKIELDLAHKRVSLKRISELNSQNEAIMLDKISTMNKLVKDSHIIKEGF